MSLWTLAAGALLLGLAAALLALAGGLALGRGVDERDRIALRLFGVWWLCAALVLAMLGLHTVLGLAGVLDPAVHAGLVTARAAPLAVALWALLSYLIYLLTGRRLHVPLALVYAGFFAFTLWNQAAQGPYHVEVGTWAVRVVGANPSSPAVAVLYGLLLAGPLLLAAVAYTVLAFRLRLPPQRYRASLVALALLQVFAALLVGFAARWTDQPWYPLTYQVPCLLLGVMVLLAYRPPAWVRRRLEARGRAVEAPRAAAR